ncbi:CvpA family protein [Psychroflexus planctonicus]|uniref:Membrane protein required for colicin V production n=1 Tax=Psychroflexus planctonicus TaxID=1526575 RepID=A0ABQ1SKU0_9FLAO|nr:CvpA family protein [Psychroflexus planctonicus]GGE40375.1 hypothetical protein GCM10010832_20650 [Psychroflexus planctonicus]
MNEIDIGIAIILAIGLVRGLMKGFILELTSLLSVVLGIVGAFSFADVVESYVIQYLDWDAKYVQLTAFVLTFLAIVILVSLIGKALTKLVNAIALGMLNRLAGGLFGLLKMALIVLVLVLIVNTINKKTGFLDNKSVFEDSVTFVFFNDLVEAYLPDLVSYAKENDMLPDEEEN